MRLDKTTMLTALIAISATLSAGTLAAQAPAKEMFGIEAGQTPVLETSVGYNYLHANAPPGQCGCFSANGGYGSIVFNMPRNLSIVADLSATHANNISSTTQSVTIFNYLFGPRYTLRSMSRRYTPYAQILGGGSHESSSYAAVQGVSGGALSVGGGISTTINRHFSWTIVEADWIHSWLPNAQNNLQNDLLIGTAITFRLGPR